MTLWKYVVILSQNLSLTKTNNRTIWRGCSKRKYRDTDVVLLKFLIYCLGNEAWILNKEINCILIILNYFKNLLKIGTILYCETHPHLVDVSDLNTNLRLLQSVIWLGKKAFLLCFIWWLNLKQSATGYCVFCATDLANRWLSMKEA